MDGYRKSSGLARRLQAGLAAFGLALMGAAAPTFAGPVDDPGVVFSHPPLNTGGPASDLAFTIDSSPPLWQQIADDFMLTEAADIRRIVFWGFYGGDFDLFPEPAPEMETFRVRFYGARPGDGLPDDDNILFNEEFLDPFRMETGTLIGTGPAPPEYVYQIDLPSALALDAATPYWLEIVQAGDIDSHFRWEVSVAEQTPFAFKNINISDWQLTTIQADTAFQLSTIPEPATLLFLVLGLLFVRPRRKGGDA